MDKKTYVIRIIKKEQIIVVHLELGPLKYNFFVNVNSFYKNNLIDKIKEENGEVRKLLLEHLICMKKESYRLCAGRKDRQEFENRFLFEKPKYN